MRKNKKKDGPRTGRKNKGKRFIKRMTISKNAELMKLSSRLDNIISSGIRIPFNIMKNVEEISKRKLNNICNSLELGHGQR